MLILVRWQLAKPMQIHLSMIANGGCTKAQSQAVSFDAPMAEAWLVNGALGYLAQHIARYGVKDCCSERYLNIEQLWLMVLKLL